MSPSHGKADFLSYLKRHWLNDLTPNTTIEAQLILQTFAIGLQNAISYAQFHCFASAQTGNTVVLALALADPHNSWDRLANTTVSLGSWLLGALLTGQTGNALGRRRRAFQVAVGLLQTSMIILAAWIEYDFRDADLSPAGSSGVRPRVGLGLLAAACGSQVAAARAWGVPEISTAMATAAWVDLLIDRRLVACRNKSRDRRALFLATLVTGSIVGAFALERVGAAEVVVLSAVLKGVVVLGLVFCS
ncbi:hypothetical protein Q7P37_006294 [Cladosporium fusiforme]